MVKFCIPFFFFIVVCVFRVFNVHFREIVTRIYRLLLRAPPLYFFSFIFSVATHIIDVEIILIMVELW